MTITLNGKKQEIGENLTISQFLESLNLHPRRVAVEVNRVIIKRDEFERHPLREGDEIEVLQFVGGGARL
ncbi:MAG: sulfur carrier protein ThiS [Candidatus Omnitrophota bacterium]|nr:MAG: sulfur carrier protein ThiS [Candidatus Omnitrophota bacterium]